MNKIATIVGLAVAASAMTATADDLIYLDLSVTNQVTISALAGNASVSATASNFTGFLFADFLSPGAVGPAIADGVGDLTTANDPSDFGPSIFNGAGNVGINIWSFSTNTNVSVTAGTQAFVGSATWALDAGAYAAMLGGNISGDIYFDADTDDDLPTATLIGTWTTVAIPAPGSMALLGLGGLVAGRRRR